MPDDYFLVFLEIEPSYPVSLMKSNGVKQCGSGLDILSLFTVFTSSAPPDPQKTQKTKTKHQLLHKGVSDLSRALSVSGTQFAEKRGFKKKRGTALLWCEAGKEETSSGCQTPAAEGNGRTLVIHPFRP